MATPTVVRVGLFALAIVALGFVPGVSGADSPSAKGRGDFMSNGNVRAFSFKAIQDDNGVVTGQAKVRIRATGTVVDMAIDCLRFVTSNTVLVSGTIRKSNVSTLSVGQNGIFEAQDNGKGNDEADDNGKDSDEADDKGKGSDSPPDRLSLLIPAGTLDCKASLDLGLMDLQHGNIKVRPNEEGRQEEEGQKQGRQEEGRPN